MPGAGKDSTQMHEDYDTNENVKGIDEQKSDDLAPESCNVDDNNASNVDFPMTRTKWVLYTLMACADQPGSILVWCSCSKCCYE